MTTWRSTYSREEEVYTQANTHPHQYKHNSLQTSMEQLHINVFLFFGGGALLNKLYFLGKKWKLFRLNHTTPVNTDRCPTGGRLFYILYVFLWQSCPSVLVCSMFDEIWWSLFYLAKACSKLWTDTSDICTHVK